MALACARVTGSLNNSILDPCSGISSDILLTTSHSIFMAQQFFPILFIFFITPKGDIITSCDYGDKKCGGGNKFLFRVLQY